MTPNELKAALDAVDWDYLTDGELNAFANALKYGDAYLRREKQQRAWEAQDAKRRANPPREATQDEKDRAMYENAGPRPGSNWRGD